MDLKNLLVYKIVLGWLLSSFLVFRYWQTNISTGNSFHNFRFIFENSCDEIINRDYSWHLGFPIASIAMVYFGFLGILISLNRIQTDLFVFLISAFSIGVSLILALKLVKLQINCKIYWLILIINFFIFINCFSIHISSLFFNIFKKASNILNNLLKIIILISIIILGSISEVWLSRVSSDSDLPSKINEISNQFQKSTINKIPYSESSPRLGPINAPIHLVVFSSFQCTSCKVFAFTLENIKKKLGSGIVISFRNFPLNTDCNPLMTINMQPNACEASFAAMAAHQQNLFWQFHNALFKTDLSADELSLYKIALNIGLNIEKWNSDRKSLEIKNIIQDDLALATLLKINATPTIFINGKKLMNLQENVILYLIQKELENSKIKENNN